MRKNKGFTLIELMVVIVIIGILAALAIPKFMDASAKAKMSEAPTVLASYESGQLAFVAEKGWVGDSASIVFTPPAVSKWWTYNVSGGSPDGVTPADGICSGTATSDMGDFKSTNKLLTTVKKDSSNTVTHSQSGSTDAIAKKYLPNFMP